MTRKRYTRIPHPSKDTKNGKGAQHLGRHQVYNNRSEKSRGQLFPSKWVEVKLTFFCRIIIKGIHVLHMYNVIMPEKMHLYKSMFSKPWAVKKNVPHYWKHTHTHTHTKTTVMFIENLYISIICVRLKRTLILNWHLITLFVIIEKFDIQLILNVKNCYGLEESI